MPSLEESKKNTCIIYIVSQILSTLVLSFILSIVITFSNYLLTSFFLTNTISVLKLCLVASFLTLLSSIPLIGLYFLFSFPFWFIEVVQTLKIVPELNVWITFFAFFFLACGFFVDKIFKIKNHIILQEKYHELKKKSLQFRLVILLLFTILELFFIIISELFFHNCIIPII